MAIVSPGEVLDSSNPKLDLFTFIEESTLVDVQRADFQIWDLADELNPVQIYPDAVGGWEPIVLSAPPAGSRIGTGHYFAPWTVDEAIGINPHEIRWRFSLTLTSAFSLESEEFEVLALQSSTGLDPISVQAFKDCYPQFASLTSTQVQKAIDFATRYIDPTCLAECYEDAQNFLTAHFCELNYGNLAKSAGIQSVKAGPAMVTFLSTNMSQAAFHSSLKLTPYGLMFLELARGACGGMQVLC